MPAVNAQASFNMPIRDALLERLGRCDSAGRQVAERVDEGRASADAEMEVRPGPGSNHVPALDLDARSLEDGVTPRAARSLLRERSHAPCFAPRGIFAARASAPAG